MNRFTADHNRSPLPRSLFISATTRDLADYRAAAVHACQRNGILPVTVDASAPESLPPLEVCLNAVKAADSFLLIVAHHYGTAPAEMELAYTHQEYNHAFELNRQILVYTIDEAALWPADLVDRGPSSLRLQDFKDTLARRHTVARFANLEGFREDLLVRLARLSIDRPEREGYRLRPPQLLASPIYNLRQEFVGREADLNRVEAWLESQDPVLVLEGIGGQGKSALAWNALLHETIRRPPRFEAFVWWSFYHGTASTDGFVRAVSDYLLHSYENQPKVANSGMERRTQLIAALQERRCLVVLDGVERLLAAYHRLEPYGVRDEGVDATLRSCVEPEDASLLRALGVGRTKTLITSRLLPYELQTPAGTPAMGITRYRLRGLEPDDAVLLAQKLGVRGSTTEMRVWFQRFDNHPLLISILCGLVRRFRRSPGDFDAWAAEAERHDDYGLRATPLSTRRANLLRHSMGQLSEDDLSVLSSIALFGEELTYDTLTEIDPFVSAFKRSRARPPTRPPQYEGMLSDWSTAKGIAGREAQVSKVLIIYQELRTARDPEHLELLEAWHAARDQEERGAYGQLDRSLQNLGDLGLLHWNREENTYDLHAVVRGHVCDEASGTDRDLTYGRISDHFVALPSVDPLQARTVDDLRREIILARALLASERMSEADDVLTREVVLALLFRVWQPRLIAELLEPLVVWKRESRVAQNELTALALAKAALGRIEESVTLHWEELRSSMARNKAIGVWVSMRNLRGIVTDAAVSARLADFSRRLTPFCGSDESAMQALTDARRALGQHDPKSAQQHYEAFRVHPPPGLGYCRPGDPELFECELHLELGELTDDKIGRTRSAMEMGCNRGGLRELLMLEAKYKSGSGQHEQAVRAAREAVEIAEADGYFPGKELGALRGILDAADLTVHDPRLDETSPSPDNPRRGGAVPRAVERWLDECEEWVRGLEAGGDG